jgi:hypothetical protein
MILFVTIRGSILMLVHYSPANTPLGYEDSAYNDKSNADDDALLLMCKFAYIFNTFAKVRR